MADPQRVIVFVDYRTLQLSALEAFHPPGTPVNYRHVDPLRLGQHLVKRRKYGGVLAGVRAYRGRPNPNRHARSAAANDRQTDLWTRDPLVTVLRRTLTYPSDWSVSPPREKGVDVTLAVDLVRLAVAYDVDILFFRDTDLMPALETVTELAAAQLKWPPGAAPAACVPRHEHAVMSLPRPRRLRRGRRPHRLPDRRRVAREGKPRKSRRTAGAIQTAYARGSGDDLSRSAATCSTYS